MNNTSDEINDKFDLIIKEIAQLRTEINEIRVNTAPLNSHIEFINSIYNKLKAPIDYISSMKIFSIE